MQLFAKSVKLQEEAGFKSQLYQANELQQLVPHINAEGLEGGLFGPDDGFLDPYEMCTFLAEKVRARGGGNTPFFTNLARARRDGGVTRAPPPGAVRGLLL